MRFGAGTIKGAATNGQPATCEKGWGFGQNSDDMKVCGDALEASSGTKVRDDA